MKHLTRVASILVTAAVLAGCKSLDSGAVEAFSKTHSCPEARITVKERTDVDIYAATFGDTKGEPTPEIKADPERYALWQRQQAEQRAAFNSQGGVYEVHGCDDEELLRCFHPDSSDGRKILSEVACVTVPQPETSP